MVVFSYILNIIIAYLANSFILLRFSFRVVFIIRGSWSPISDKLILDWFNFVQKLIFSLFVLVVVTEKEKLNKMILKKKKKKVHKQCDPSYKSKKAYGKPSKSNRPYARKKSTESLA